MRPMLKWGVIATAGLAGVLVLAVGYVFIASQVMLDRTYPKVPSAVHSSADPAAVARGARLVALETCWGCHGNDLTGQIFVYDGGPEQVPNLTVLGQRFSDADFDRAIRRCVLPDGRSSLMMPCEAFTALTDEESSSIISYLRSLPARGTVSSRPAMGPVKRLHLVTGGLVPEVDKMAASGPPIDLAPRYQRGRHLAWVVCGVCHQPDLSGNPGVGSTNLGIISVYSRDDFHTLLRTGKATGGREVGVMSFAARRALNENLSDDEIDAIYDYLVARTHAVGDLSRATAVQDGQ
jgi:mono/diheme cytochrome c family protein